MAHYTSQILVFFCIIHLYQIHPANSYHPIHLFIYSFIHLFIYSFIHLFIYLFVHLIITFHFHPNSSFIHLFNLIHYFAFRTNYRVKYKKNDNSP